MKKSLIVLLSMVFVLSSFAIVFADDAGMDSVRAGIEGSTVVIGGDAYVRGIWKDNYDMDDSAADADDRFWDQRVRIKITAKAGDAELRTRLTTDDDTWNGTSNTGGTLGVDFAYLHVPVGPVTLDIGRQKSKWGNKLLDTGNSKDRAKVSAKFGDTAVGAFTDKITETNATAGDKNLDDVDRYGFYGIHKAGDIEGGLLIELHSDDTQNNADGTRGSAYVKANVAGLAVKAELAMESGDYYEETDKDSNKNDTMGGFVSVSKELNDKLSVSGIAAFTSDGYVADKHFTPTLMIGDDNTAALNGMNFGQDPNGNKQDSLLFVVGVDVQATPELSVYGKLAYLSLDAYAANFVNNSTSASATEFDAGLEYQLAQNTTLNVDFGYMSPDDITAQDDAAMTATQSISFKF